MYVHLEGDRTNLVQTAWCLMGLIEAGQVTLLLINANEIEIENCFDRNSKFL